VARTYGASMVILVVRYFGEKVGVCKEVSERAERIGDVLCQGRRRFIVTGPTGMGRETMILQWD